LIKERRLDVVNKRNKIIDRIVNSEPDGRRVMEIAKDTDLNRETISIHCKELEYDDLAITRKNKQSPYHLTQKMYGNPRAASFFFQIEATDKIREGDTWISDNSRFCNIDYCFTIINAIYNLKDPDNSHKIRHEFEQLVLFEFGNRIGALVLYTMLQAIRPTKEDVQKIAREKMPLKGKDKDEAGKSWIESISMDRIFQEFSRLPMIRERLIPSKHKQQRQKKNTTQPSSYEMKERDFDMLENMFSSVYPDFYKKLDSIRKNVVNNKLNMIYGAKKAYLQKIEQDPKHTKCNGILLPEIKTNMGGKKVQQCNQCHSWIEVKIK
jgi:hypothetical protein